MLKTNTLIALSLTAALAGTLWAAPGDNIPMAPTADKATKQVKEGDMGDVIIKGQSREKMKVGKIDPPAAFNLEDIQNFPEERLQPVLNNPVNFEEGHDFSTLLDFKEDQPVHPWLAEIPKAPFLTMRVPSMEKPREWTFAIIDQGGANAFRLEGKGTPPTTLIWNGEDSQRGHAAVDTVYIPQLATVDKEGYHHTYMGEPVQLSALIYKDQGKTMIEISSKKLFLENKADMSKEATLLLDKVCDLIRENGYLPFSIQPFDVDTDLARNRQQVLVKYFADKLTISENQIVSSPTGSPEKRGASIVISASAVPGGSGS